MDQHQSVHFAERNQARSNGSLAKGCRSTKDAFIVKSQRLCRFYLRRPTVTTKIQLYRNSAESVIYNFDRDAMAIKTDQVLLSASHEATQCDDASPQRKR